MLCGHSLVPWSLLHMHAHMSLYKAACVAADLWPCHPHLTAFAAGCRVPEGGGQPV